MNRIEKGLKDAQRKTLGRVMTIPERGSRLNKLGWIAVPFLVALLGYGLFVGF